MKLLQMEKLREGVVDSLKDSFDRLPNTSHKDGMYRLRRYSVIELRTTFWDGKTEAHVNSLVSRDFVQSEELNKHQGGMVRSFEEIEDETLQSEALKEALLLFKQANKLIDGQEVEIHQMRVVAEGQKISQLSPEGVHQDGFDYIAMLAVGRSNLSGGSLLVYDGKDDKEIPFFSKELADGDIVMLDDRELWHNAQDVWVKNSFPELKGSADFFIFCARK